MTTEATGPGVNYQAAEFLDYYCDDKTRADYAVLIDGAWGSGKTLFILDYLKKHNTKLKRQDPLQPNAIYVSLFGLRTSEDVRAALFAAAHRYLATGTSRFVGLVAAGLLDKFTGVKNLKPADYVKIDASIVVFDDLERTSIAPADVLGIVNGFIDSARGTPFKVIVIANQAEIEQSEQYLRQKEKVIGRTLVIRPDARAATGTFVAAMRNDRAREQARQSQDQILGQFQAWGRGNLRSLRHALADFDRLVAATEDLLIDKPKALDALLPFSIALGLEARTEGALVDNDEDGPSSLTDQAMFSGDGAQRARDIMEKYPEVRWRDPIVSETHIKVLATSGRIDVQYLREQLAAHPLVAGPQSSPSWRRLWSWPDLSPSEYVEVRTSFLAALEAGEYKRPAEILHAAGVVLNLAESGDRLFDDPVARFSAYIDALAAAGELAAELRALDPDEDIAWGLAYQARGTADFAAIRAHLLVAVTGAHAEAMKSVAARVLAAALAGQSVQAELLGDIDLDGGYDGVPFLHYTDPSRFADALLLGGHLNRLLISTLSNRYKAAISYPELLAERDWLLAVDAEMAKRAATAPPPYATAWPKMFNYWFEPMKTNLEKAAKLLAEFSAPEGD